MYLENMHTCLENRLFEHFFFQPKSLVMWSKWILYTWNWTLMLTKYSSHVSYMLYLLASNIIYSSTNTLIKILFCFFFCCCFCHGESRLRRSHDSCHVSHLFKKEQRAQKEDAQVRKCTLFYRLKNIMWHKIGLSCYLFSMLNPNTP